MQLFIDGVGRSPSLWTARAAMRVSRKIVKAANMQVFFGPKAYEKGSLLVCFTMIAESHVSLHLDRKSGVAYVDIFTCKETSEEDMQRLANIVQEGLNIAVGKSYAFDRGKLPPLGQPPPVTQKDPTVLV